MPGSSDLLSITYLGTRPGALVFNVRSEHQHTLKKLVS